MGGLHIVMWLNQRLMIKLLPHLFSWLERQSGDSIPLEIAQSFAQKAAKDDLLPEEPVKRREDSREWLVGSVDLTPAENTIVMTFRADKNQKSTLSLQTQALRQWLEIVFLLWCRAEWPLEIWPSWMSDKKVSVQSRRSTALH